MQFKLSLLPLAEENSLKKFVGLNSNNIKLSHVIHLMSFQNKLKLWWNSYNVLKILCKIIKRIMGSNVGKTE